MVKPGQVLYLADPYDSFVKEIASKLSKHELTGRSPKISLDRLSDEMVAQHGGLFREKHRVEIRLEYRESPEEFLNPEFFEKDPMQEIPWEPGFAGGNGMGNDFDHPHYPDEVRLSGGDFVGMENIQDRNVKTSGIWNGDYTLQDVVNYGMAGTGFVLGGTEGYLRNVRAGYSSRGTQTAQKVISKVVDPSIAKVARTARVLGWAGVGFNAGIVGYKWFNGEDITASQVADLAIGAGLILLGGTVAVFSAPGALIVVGGYGILDAAGAFDGVKESLGGNTIVLEGYGGF